MQFYIHLYEICVALNSNVEFGALELGMPWHLSTSLRPHMEKTLAYDHNIIQTHDNVMWDW